METYDKETGAIIFPPSDEEKILKREMYKLNKRYSHIEILLESINNKLDILCNKLDKNNK